MQVSDVVKGLEWVGINHKLPAVVTMSLGVQVTTNTQSALGHAHNVAVLCSAL